MAPITKYTYSVSGTLDAQFLYSSKMWPLNIEDKHVIYEVMDTTNGGNLEQHWFTCRPCNKQYNTINTGTPSTHLHHHTIPHLPHPPYPSPHTYLS